MSLLSRPFSRRPRQEKTRRSDRRRAKRRVLVETLEKRHLLTTLFVNNTLDDTLGNLSGDGELSLREAIQLANNPGTTIDGFTSNDVQDTIEFDSGLSGQITLSGTRLAISSDLTITGPGAGLLTISGNNASQIFHVSGATSIVTLSGMTLTGGVSPLEGGAVENVQANLTINDSTITSNTAGTDFGGGGGVSNDLGGTLSVNRSTISGNSATYGGGIYSDDTAFVNDSTITGNTAADNGGGLNNTGNMTVTGSTISGNTAGSGGGGITDFNVMTITNSTVVENVSSYSGGGLLAETTTLINSIVAGNVNGGTADDIGGSNLQAGSINNLIGDPNSAGGLGEGDAGNNLVGDGIGGLLPLASIVDPLADNGGPTQTHALVSGSRAIDNGSTLQVHDYGLNGSFADSLGGSDLVGLGGTLAGGQYVFDTNEGLSLSSPAIDSDEYTIEIDFTFDTLSGFQKIIDFENLGSDSGVYSEGTDLVFYDTVSFDSVATATDVLSVGVQHNLVVTRSASSQQVTALLDGQLAFSFTDVNDQAVLTGPSQVIHFLVDDTITGFEAGPGSVDQINLFPIPLDFDQRGVPFERVFMSTVDMGAFEAQPLIVIVGNTNESGPGSLRAAIELANSTPNTFGLPDTIFFDIPGPGPHLIEPLSPLPIISDPLVIDGTTEPDYAGTPVVQLDGGNTVTDGLLITAGDSSVFGLSVTGFVDAGIEFFGAGSSGSTAAFNYLGIDPSGVADGNRFGMKVINSPGNFIQENLISGNRDNGVFINGVPATGNLVTGNQIGTDPSGTARVPNLRHGVALFAPGNFIDGNLISGNNGWGVFTRFATGGSNQITNNLIGTDSAGTTSVANASGIQLRSPDNVITGNTVSGNVQGVIIALADSANTTVQGNFIGTDPSGTVDVGNSVFGVGIFDSDGNTIGGLDPGQGNVISGNGLDGVILARPGATLNFIAGNLIGTDIFGEVAIPNDGDGVRIVQGANNNFVEVNTVSGNGVRGVAIDGATTANNVISGNLIGTNSFGDSPLHNSNGVAVLLTAPDNTVTGNLVSAIDAAIVAFTTKATGNNIEFNTIGVDPALATPDGIHLLNGAANTSVLGNTVANGNRGIILTNAAQGNDLSENILFGNLSIGIDLNADGPSANDPDDVDEGENRLQNTPDVSAATLVGNDVEVSYDVFSEPGSSASYPLRVEFFATGDGQARVLLGTDTFTETDYINANRTTTLNNVVGLLLLGDQLTATATDADGNTSELSIGVLIEELGP